MRAKKCKLSMDAADDEERKPAAGDAGRSNGKGKEVAAEPPKDYIHVRARRAKPRTATASPSGYAAGEHSV